MSPAYQVPRPDVAVPVEGAGPRHPVGDAEHVGEAAHEPEVVGAADRFGREIEASADNQQPHVRVPLARRVEGLDEGVQPLAGIDVTPVEEHQLRLRDAERLANLLSDFERRILGEPDQRRGWEDGRLVCNVRILLEEPFAMRAAEDDDACAVAQKGAEDVMEALAAGPQAHHGSQPPSQERVRVGEIVDVLELGDARHSRDHAVADRRQERDHRVMAVHPADVKKQHHVGTNLAQAGDHPREIPPAPVVYDRVRHDLPRRRRRCDAAAPAEDVHPQSCPDQVLADVQRVVRFRGRFRRKRGNHQDGADRTIRPPRLRIRHPAGVSGRLVAIVRLRRAPRFLSGEEAIPLASGGGDHLQTVELGRQGLRLRDQPLQALLLLAAHLREHARVHHADLLAPRRRHRGRQSGVRGRCNRRDEQQDVLRVPGLDVR